MKCFIGDSQPVQIKSSTFLCMPNFTLLKHTLELHSIPLPLQSSTPPYSLRFLFWYGFPLVLNPCAFVDDTFLHKSKFQTWRLRASYYS